MKKTLLQVMIEFTANVKRLRSAKKNKGNGKNQSAAAALTLFFLLASFHTFAITYYSRTSGGNWNVNSTWSTVTYGNATNTGTYPKAGDIANIGNGYTIYIASSVTCATINVGQGVSGILEYRSTGAFIVSVTGNITVNTGARFRYNTAVNITHNCYVGGNFTNYGIVDFYMAAAQIVNLTFNGNSNSTVTGTGTWDLNIVTLNKTTSTANMLDVLTINFELGVRTFSGIYGTYVHNNTGSYSINPTVATFTIGSNVIFRVPTGTLRFASSGSTVILQGSLYVSGGTVQIASGAGTQGLQSDRNGTFTPYLEVSAGTLNVYGGITYGGGSALEPFSFRMTGGAINLSLGSSGTSRQIFCVNDVAGSVFFMSAGTITFQRATTGGVTVIDAQVCGTNGTVTTTGGIMQFGNASTATGAVFNFKPFPAATYPHFRVSGSAGAVVSVRTSNSSTANFRLMSLTIDANKTFDIRSISGTVGDGKQMTLLGRASGIDALVNNGTFTQRLSTVTFNTSGGQGIGGTVITTFYNLSINNASNIILNRAANVSNFLSMVSGKLITTNTNILTCQAAANANLGTALTYVDGPMVHTVASASTTVKTYPVGKSTAWRPVVLTVRHTNATSVTYRSEVYNASAAALPYTKPPTISNVSQIRYTRFIRQAVANFMNGTIQMYYGTDDLVLDYTTLKVVHDNGATMWTNIGGTATANFTGNIVSASFTSFNTYFALANPPGGNNPLPVTLTAFNANLINRKVNIDWVTKSEVNNDRFVVERSVDNKNFSPIGTVAGSGNSTTEHSYSLVDENPIRGISYYRLKQFDYDGTMQIFRSVSVSYLIKGVFETYPTVNDGSNIHLRYSDSDLKYYSITVSDVTGKIIPSIVNAVSGGIDVSIDESYRKSGNLYFISAVNGNDLLQSKIIISKD